MIAGVFILLYIELARIHPALVMFVNYSNTDNIYLHHMFDIFRISHYYA